MPQVDNVHVYTDGQPPVLLISNATGHRTLAGSYVGVHGQTHGAAIVEGVQYRITEGGPYHAGNNPGVLKTCNSVDDTNSGSFAFT
jgi:hypothetical protein